MSARSYRRQLRRPPVRRYLSPPRRIRMPEPCANNLQNSDKFSLALGEITPLLRWVAGNPRPGYRTIAARRAQSGRHHILSTIFPRRPWCGAPCGAWRRAARPTRRSPCAQLRVVGQNADDGGGPVIDRKSGRVGRPHGAGVSCPGSGVAR